MAEQQLAEKNGQNVTCFLEAISSARFFSASSRILRSISSRFFRSSSCRAEKSLDFNGVNRSFQVVEQRLMAKNRNHQKLEPQTQPTGRLLFTYVGVYGRH